MRVEDSKYKDSYERKVVLDSGNYYFFKKFIVAENKTGIHFTWEVAKEVISLAYEHYGDDIQVTYISNRVNEYTLKAQDWLNFYKERHHLEAIAIVAYNKLGIMNVILEMVFNHIKFRKFNSLDDAINWVDSLDY
ncbi:hypothetical protein [Ulvibacter antarcticus]|uniref:SpoIIAA-like protein n=1 Tax=Ulvibacter antarcticus TaxID=442714 RepID=A0A3L9ZCQ6_9FLAO|nr:hypothetical protein [Ulvibacter antarcticus]RMA64432.1 hypothetical protein BXY75_1307 [Ulvibacter antarcticus]